MTAALVTMSVRFTGEVAFSDNSKDSFVVTVEDGVGAAPATVVIPAGYSSLLIFQQLWQAANAQVKALLGLLGGTTTLAPGTPATKRTMTDWTLTFAGVVARADNTRDTFMVVHDKKGGNRVVNPTVYDEILKNTTLKGLLTTALLSLSKSVTLVA